MAENNQSNTGNIREEYNLARIGLDMDSSTNQIAKGKLSYALNAVVENFDSDSVNYQNEPGNELCLDFPLDYHLIGTHFIPEKNKHIFFLVNPSTGLSEIGYMNNNDCIYHTLVSANCLNFNIDNPIHKVVHKITNCTTEIYWTDGLNPRRYLDIENIPYILSYPIALGGNIDLCGITETKQLDCNKLNVQPNFDIPKLEVVDINTGGELQAGTYQFAIQYCDANGNPYTSYYSITNPTPIFDPAKTTLNFNYTVGRSIVVNVSNLDISGLFEYFNIAVIKTVNAISSVELIGTYFINNVSRQIVYTGQNVTQIRLTINDIFEKFPYYDVAEDLTTVQDILVWDGLTSIDRINYQKIANQIDLKWQSYRIPNTETYADELNATNYRGYLRDEVYAFEIVFLLKNGRQTDGFHIPGRVLTYNETSEPLVPTTNPDFVGDPEFESGGVGYTSYWKVYNTASVIGFAPEYSAATDKTTYKGPYQYGEFAYWESTEKYPCNTDLWGELANQPIRHHKFPDVLVSPIFESPVYALGPGFSPVMQNDAIFPIGVRIDIQQVSQLIYTSDLTKEQKESIVAFKIVRGDRSTNKSIVSKGILRNVGKYNREGTDYYYPNYPYNDLRKDPFILSKSNAYKDECKVYTGTPSVSGTYQYTDCYTNATVVANMTAGTSITITSLSTPIAITGTVTFTVSTQPLSDFYKTPELEGFSSNETKYRHVFNSPETLFGQPYLGNVLKLENVILGGGKAHFVEVKNHALYKLLTKEAQEDALKSSTDIASITGTLDPTVLFTAYQAYLQIYINGITRKNYTYSFNSIASYDYSADIVNNIGVKQRPLALAQYIFEGFQAVGETNGININNYNRESSVYLKTIESRNGVTVSPLPFPDKTPSIAPTGVSLFTDDSRFVASDDNKCAVPNEQRHINVISYYASMKNIFVNQWGQIYSYDTIDTGFQSNIQVDNILNGQPSIATVFGGDTFIGKFAFKTKLPFFIDNRVGAPDDSDIFYDEIGNIAYPKYWYSSRSILSDYPVPGGTTMKNIISVKARNFDCPNSQLPAPDPGPPVVVNPNRTFYDGKMYLFAYGIPYFYVESSINVDLRQAFNNQEGDFYPHVSTGIPDNWLQESVVPIAQDNTYYYNVTYSKQNKENLFTHLPNNWETKACFTTFPFRAIYSDQQESFTNSGVNNWLNYSATSYFDFPQNFGKLISLDGIQNKAVLARFENKSLLYNTMLTVQTSNPQAAYLGNDTLFKSAPPIDFAETDLGYVGSQNKFLLKIPQGQITVDAKRGQVFLIAGNQATDLSAFGLGMNKFFTDHLAFEILRYFPTVNTDNHFNGIGLHGVYDSKFDRVIISKLDYIPLSNDVKYDEETKDFYVERVVNGVTFKDVVDLSDTDYFCNKSWTLSFNMNTKSWISFHSYIPNFYIAENNFFYSGINGGCDLEALAFEELPPTTTTTTTEPIPIDFSFVYTCICVGNGCGRISVGPTGVYPEGYITGGSGEYDINPFPYPSAAEALTGEFSLNVTHLQNDEVDNGTWYIAVRDHNNPSNITVKSITINCNNYPIVLGPAAETSGEACSLYPVGPTTTYWTTTSGTTVDLTIFYTDPACTIPFNGGTLYYSDGTNYYLIGPEGLLYNFFTCPVLPAVYNLTLRLTAYETVSPSKVKPFYKVNSGSWQPFISNPEAVVSVQAGGSGMYALNAFGIYASPGDLVSVMFKDLAGNEIEFGEGVNNFFNKTDQTRYMGYCGTLDPFSFTATSIPPGYAYEVYFNINAVSNNYVPCTPPTITNMYIGGPFTTYNSVSKDNLIALNNDATIYYGFNSETFSDSFSAESDIIRSIIIQPDKKILVGGYFKKYDGATQYFIIRLNTDGTKDNTFDTTSSIGLANGPLYSMGLQSNNKIIVSCGRNIFRLNTDGTIDSSFASVYFNTYSESITIQPDDKIVCCGNFSYLNGINISNDITRLLSDGSLDTSFTLPLFGGFYASQSILKIALQSDGKIICGGTFTTFNISSKNRIARLLSNGNIDNTFVIGAGFNDTVLTVTVQADQKILVGGWFTSYNGTSCPRLIRLLSTGTIDSSFNISSGFDGPVRSIVIQPDNKILIGGAFTSYNGYTCNNLVRLLENGDIDLSFDTSIGFNNTVYAITLNS